MLFRNSLQKMLLHFLPPAFHFLPDSMRFFCQQNSTAPAVFLIDDALYEALFPQPFQQADNRWVLKIEMYFNIPLCDFRERCVIQKEKEFGLRNRKSNAFKLAVGVVGKSVADLFQREAD